jgi:hypothetical protein
VTIDGVVGDTETSLVMRLMEEHVDPSTVLMIPCLVGVSGALLQEGVADLPIAILLMEDVSICQVNLPVEVLKACSLSKSDELVIYKVLDKSVSVNGNPTTNVAVIYKGLGGEQGTEVCEGGITASSRRTCLMSENTSSATGVVREVQTDASCAPK